MEKCAIFKNKNLSLSHSHCLRYEKVEFIGVWVRRTTEFKLGIFLLNSSDNVRFQATIDSMMDAGMCPEIDWIKRKLTHHRCYCFHSWIELKSICAKPVVRRNEWNREVMGEKRKTMRWNGTNHVVWSDSRCPPSVQFRYENSVKNFCSFLFEFSSFGWKKNFYVSSILTSFDLWRLL